MGGADKSASNVVVVTNFGALCFILYKLVTEDVALSAIIICCLLANTKALHCPIRLNNRHDLCFTHDKQVKKLGEHVYSDIHH